LTLLQSCTQWISSLFSQSYNRNSAILRGSRGAEYTLKNASAPWARLTCNSFSSHGTSHRLTEVIGVGRALWVANRSQLGLSGRSIHHWEDLILIFQSHRMTLATCQRTFHHQAGICCDLVAQSVWLRLLAHSEVTGWFGTRCDGLQSYEA